MLQSSLKETANIPLRLLCRGPGRYDQIKYPGFPPPTLAIDMVGGAILDFIFIQIAQYSEEALYIKTEMKVSEVNLEGLFLLFPSIESLSKVFRRSG